MQWNQYISWSPCLLLMRPQSSLSSSSEVGFTEESSFPFWGSSLPSDITSSMNMSMSMPRLAYSESCRKNVGLLRISSAFREQGRLLYDRDRRWDLVDRLLPLPRCTPLYSKRCSKIMSRGSLAIMANHGLFPSWSGVLCDLAFCDSWEYMRIFYLVGIVWLLTLLI